MASSADIRASHNDSGNWYNMSEETCSKWRENSTKFTGTVLLLKNWAVVVSHLPHSLPLYNTIQQNFNVNLLTKIVICLKETSISVQFTPQINSTKFWICMNNCFFMFPKWNSKIQYQGWNGWSILRKRGLLIVYEKIIFLEENNRRYPFTSETEIKFCPHPVESSAIQDLLVRPLSRTVAE